MFGVSIKSGTSQSLQFVRPRVCYEWHERGPHLLIRKRIPVPIIHQRAGFVASYIHKAVVFCAKDVEARLWTLDRETCIGRCERVFRLFPCS